VFVKTKKKKSKSKFKTRTRRSSVKSKENVDVLFFYKKINNSTFKKKKGEKN